uniref:Uncharacterized protein n=1 Tax=Anopheles coluzzii TaxID=1518534 RepID=A0A8W7P637_ANOCL
MYPPSMMAAISGSSTSIRSNQTGLVWRTVRYFSSMAQACGIEYFLVRRKRNRNSASVRQRLMCGLLAMNSRIWASPCVRRCSSSRSSDLAVLRSLSESVQVYGWVTVHAHPKPITSWNDDDDDELGQGALMHTTVRYGGQRRNWLSKTLLQTGYRVFFAIFSAKLGVLTKCSSWMRIGTALFRYVARSRISFSVTSPNMPIVMPDRSYTSTNPAHCTDASSYSVSPTSICIRLPCPTVYTFGSSVPASPKITVRPRASFSSSG